MNRISRRFALLLLVATLFPCGPISPALAQDLPPLPPPVEEPPPDARAARRQVEQDAAERRAALARITAEAENAADLAAGAMVERRRQVEAALERFRTRLAEHRQSAADVAALLPYTEDHDAKADALYNDLRELIFALRREVNEATRLLLEAESRISDRRSQNADARHAFAEQSRMLDGGDSSDSPPSAVVNALEKRFEEALTARLDAAAQRLEIEQIHRDEALVLLKTAKDLRRAFRDEVSDAALDADHGYLIEDLESEIHLILPNLEAFARHRLRALRELPQRWRDWSFFETLLREGLWLVLVALAWWWARQKAPLLLPLLLRRWADRHPRYVRQDLRSLEEPSARAVRAGIDLVASWLLLGPIGRRVPELGLLVLLYWQVAFYRLALAASAMAFAVHPEVRPSLATLRQPTRRLVLRSVHFFILWLIGRQLSSWICLRLLAAVSLHELSRFVFDLVLLPIFGLWFFHVFEPLLRRKLRHRLVDHEVAAALVPHLRRRRGFLRVAQGVLEALAIFCLAIYDSGWRGRWLPRLLPGLRARPAVDESKAELCGEVVRELERADRLAKHWVPRPADRDELARIYSAWIAEPKLMTVLVTGAEGSGKKSFVEHWVRSLTASVSPAEPPVHRLRLARRLSSQEEAREWLAEGLGIERPPAGAEALAGRLTSDLGDAVVVLEDLHFAFVRQVGGFAAIRYLLAVMSASHRLFWLCGLHRPAWRFLHSTDLVPTEAFHHVIELEPFDERALRTLVERRIATAGRELDFTPLLSSRASARRHSSAHQRAAAEYFRRLAWSSGGNPWVALRLCRETLATPANGDEPTVAVTRFADETDCGELRDADLFVLAAIHTHRALREENLVRVTNMSPAAVRAVRRHLASRGLLVERAQLLSVAPRHLPTVVRRLKRRHFIHGST